MPHLRSTLGIIAAICSGSMVCAQVHRPARATARPAAKVGSTTPAPAKTPPVYYDFKGARLGMSRAEWTALPLPVRDSSYRSKYDGPVRAWCSDDVDTKGKPVSGFYINQTDRSAGVIECRYASLSTIGSYMSLTPAYVAIGEHIASNVTYRFLDGKLYEISITGAAALLGDVMDGLSAKWDKPTTEINDTTQNKMGATFPHTVKLWVNPAATIRVETPWTKIDDLNVLYSDNATAARLDALDKAAHPAAEKM